MQCCAVLNADAHFLFLGSVSLFLFVCFGLSLDDKDSTIELKEEQGKEPRSTFLLRSLKKPLHQHDNLASEH
ncbi:hypothetical protein RJT34_12834 [Clitoria ternatea]|uniref:Uncharacterized protein n=1 Tax=Clitoria ternatea TaxID=43366 RepID=A0AAN9JQL0_CLITE